MNQEFSLGMQEKNRVLDAVSDLIREAYDNSDEHGFHKAYDALLEAAPADLKRDQRRTAILAKLALIASEVGEAVRAVQHGDEPGLAMELADVIIRIFDLCGSEYIELGRVMLVKMEKNRARPYLHGKEC